MLAKIDSKRNITIDEYLAEAEAQKAKQKSEMIVLCDNEQYIVNKAISTSKTLSNMISDVDDNRQYPCIPTKYKICLTNDLPSFSVIALEIEIIKLMKKEYEPDPRIVDLQEKLNQQLDFMIYMLEFYDFLDLDIKFIISLAEHIGIILNEYPQDHKIPEELLSYIINAYPRLLENEYYASYHYLLKSNDTQNNWVFDGINNFVRNLGKIQNEDNNISLKQDIRNHQSLNFMWFNGNTNALTEEREHKTGKPTILDLFVNLILTTKDTTL